MVVRGYLPTSIVGTTTVSSSTYQLTMNVPTSEMVVRKSGLCV